MNIKKEKELEILEKKFYNKRLDLSQQQKTEKNFTENKRILNKRQIRDNTYSGFQNNYGTTTEPSNLNIYNNTNGNLNQEENNNSNNSNNSNNNDNNDNKENKELNGVENEFNKENNNE
jgi:hypothetical protein